MSVNRGREAAAGSWPKYGPGKDGEGVRPRQGAGRMVFTGKRGQRWNGVNERMVNVKPVQQGKTTRMSFARIDEVLGMPNLIEVQKNSYQWFLDEGLKAVFRHVSSITDYKGNFVLDLSHIHN